METNTKNLLLTYISGTATAEESAQAEAWISQSEDHERAFIALYEDWHRALGTQHRNIDTEKAYNRFVAENTVRSASSFPKSWLAYAASLLLFCSLAGLFYFNWSRPQQSWQEISVAKGEKKQIVLPDGTKVFINAASSLKYDEGFGKSNRNIFLDGEACFDIAETRMDIPFIVHAGGFIVRDIGTIFNIKAYADERVFESSVLEGEISVEGKISGEQKRSSRVFVTKDQMLRIKKEENRELSDGLSSKTERENLIKPLEIIDLQPEVHVEPAAWINDHLVFDNSSLEDIIRTLNRKFNKEIIVKTADLKKYHYSGTFKNATDVYQILDIIKETTSISYTTKGETIIIK